MNPRVSYPFSPSLETENELKKYPFAKLNYFAVALAGPTNYPVASDEIYFLIQEGFFDKEEAFQWQEERTLDGKGVSLTILPARHLIVLPQDATNLTNTEYQKLKLSEYHEYRDRKEKFDQDRMRKLKSDPDRVEDVDQLENIIESQQALSPSSIVKNDQKEDQEKKVEDKSSCLKKLNPTLHKIPDSLKYNESCYCLAQIIPTSAIGTPLLILVGGASTEKNVSEFANALTTTPHHYSGLRLGDLVPIKYNIWYGTNYNISNTGERHWTLKEINEDPKISTLVQDLYEKGT